MGRMLDKGGKGFFLLGPDPDRINRVDRWKDDP
jgi:hypothetical protein